MRTEQPTGFKAVLVLLTWLLLSSCASHPGALSAREMNAECAIELQAARTAMNLRNKHKPAEFLTSQLPPNDTQATAAVKNLHEIVHEVYDNPTLTTDNYAIYRFETCLRRYRNKPRPQSVSPLISGMQTCQQQYQQKDPARYTHCIIKVMDKHTIWPKLDEVIE